ncbi:MAG TPA: DUF3048 domain-containing protein [Candidatus Saccharimonadales bacterium]|nr:DUF3048 domain-containing protein [Candidatus Saccharimonadales bacterium]
MIDDVKPIKKKSSKPIKVMPSRIGNHHVMPKNSLDKPDSSELGPEPTHFGPPPKLKKHRLKDLIKRLKRLTWKEWLMIAGATLVVVGGMVIAYLQVRKTPTLAPITAKKAASKAKKSTTEPSKLTGLMVPVAYNKLPVTGVMIENSPDARPQSGLKDAGVVFEAVAEGGITRFLALFQNPSVPDYIGPVRSVRPYYLDYLGGFDAAVAHVGGSAEGLVQVRSLGSKDLDQSFNSGYYHRITSRYAPHNVYTSIAELSALETAKGFTTSNYVGFSRKDKETPAPTPTAKTIDLIVSGYYYNVHYDYDPATNSYKRSEGGKPHTDERTGAQLSPKVVIALVVPESPDPDGVHTYYQSIGNGTAFVFQDGVVGQLNWSKTDRNLQVHFKDDSGTEVKLDPGQTWITLVGTAGSVSFKP